MSVETDMLIDGLLDRECETGSQIVWAGANYPVSGGSQNNGKLLGQGGWRLTAQVILVLRLGTLPGGVARPKPKQHCGYISSPGAAVQNLLIDNAETLYEQVMVLYCSDPNQGA